MAHRTISATELEFAVLDPHWRAKWLAGEKPSTRSFAPLGTPGALGSRFHKEAETLIGWLTARERLVGAARIDSVGRMSGYLRSSCS